MNPFKRVTTCVVTVSFLGTAAQAMSLAQAGEPAERPPASFAGDQYVDSRGCVYLRVGDEGAVSWVPRLSQDRQVMCARHTEGAWAAGSARSAVVPVEPQTNRGEVTRVVRVNCLEGSTVTQVDLGNGQTVPVNCSPGQTEAVSYLVDHDNAERTRVIAAPPGAMVDVQPLTDPVVASAGQSAEIPVKGYRGGYRVVAREDVDRFPAGTRVAPPTYPASNAKVVVPSGYRKVWDDDRLNPNRGVQTVEGMRQTRMVWTDTVPRRLVSETTVTLHGAKAGAARSNPKSSASMQETVTTRAQPSAPTPQATGHRYVQVGRYASPANAKATIAKLRALGLRVSSATSKRGGKTVKTVLAGPFQTQSDLRSALLRLRASGFSDAFTRN